LNNREFRQYLTIKRLERDRQEVAVENAATKPPAQKSLPPRRSAEEQEDSIGISLPEYRHCLT
jgi:hypothetical protein